MARNNLFIKFLLFLRIVRWYNIGLIVLSQYLIAIMIFIPNHNFNLLLLDYKLHFLIFGTACAVAAGFIINSFYDLGKDLINKPKSVVFSKLLGKERLLNYYVVLNAIALLLMMLGSAKIFLYGGFMVFMFWFYSHKIQKMPLWREITVSLLAVAPLFAIWLHYATMHYGMILYLGSLTIVGFTRELVKDLEGHKGNIIFGYTTVVVAAGTSFTKKWLFTINFLLNLLFIFGYSVFVKKLDYFSFISGFSLFTALIISLVLLFKKNDNFNFVADNLLKMTIVVHLLSLIFSHILVF